QIVFEPQHQLAVGTVLVDHRAPPPQLAGYLVRRQTPTGDVSGSGGEQAVIVQATRHGTVVQGIRPDRAASFNPGALDQGRRAGTVRDMQESGHDVWSAQYASSVLRRRLSTERGTHDDAPH